MIYSIPHADPQVGYLYFYHPDEDPSFVSPPVPPSRLVPARDAAPVVPKDAVYVGSGLICRGIRAAGRQKQVALPFERSQGEGDALFSWAARFLLVWALGKMTDGS